MLPALARRLVLPIHERICRRPTFRRLRELERSQWMEPAALIELQETKLRRLMRHASSRIPYYRRRFVDAGGHANNDQGFDLGSLVQLPTLSKDDIRQNLNALVDPASAGERIPYTTGGSTGQPLQFHIDRSRQAADQAARARSRRWFGVDLGERELYLWGAPAELSAQDRFKSLRDRLINHRLLSAFNMTPRTMSRHLDVMQRFNPVHLFGYPSSLARLVRHARDTGRRFANPALRAVFTTGEWLDPADRSTIEEAVSCPVADGYGAREAGFIAHQCPLGAYHIAMEGVIVEILGESGHPLPAGEVGEITITNLDAWAMPFIRYRTGDLGALRAALCPCGRGLTCLEVVAGRRTDMLQTKSGGAAHALSVLYVLRDQPGIAQYQVIQQGDLSLDVRLVADSLTAQSRSRLASRLSACIGTGTPVRIHQVDRIEAASSGKHRSVISLAGGAPFYRP